MGKRQSVLWGRTGGVWVLVVILGLTGASCTTHVGGQPLVDAETRRYGDTGTVAASPTCPVAASQLSPTPNPQPLASTEPEAPTQARVQAIYSKLPLHFEPNQGQSDRQVKFLSRGNGSTLFLTPTEAVLALRQSEPRAKGKGQRAKGKREEQEKTVETTKNSLAPVSGERVRVRGIDPEPTEQTVLRMKLVGANPNPQVVGLDELPGKSNYFLGNDPSKWQTNIPHYARIKYEGLYPGIDLIYYGNQRQLEYDFVVAPGADPKAIKLSFKGADKVEIDAQCGFW